MNNIIKKSLIFLIIAYRKFFKAVFESLFHIRGPYCRFNPSCSQYAIEAIEKYGALKGTCLALYRIIRCNPFSKGGYDPVP